MSHHHTLRTLNDRTKRATSKKKETGLTQKASVVAETYDWPMIEQSYLQWHTSVFQGKNTNTPTEEQEQILMAIHLRCKYEHFIEQSLAFTKNLDGMSPEPLYRLVHGLPGAGKSQVLLWMKASC